MNKKQFLLGLLLVCVFACKDATKKSDEHQSPKNESAIEQTDDEANFSSLLNKDEVVKNIQGKWKESEYPYRMMEISGQEVKFTEEGVVEPPTFKAFEISNKCPFQVNNIKEVDKNTIILSLTEEQRCEKLKIENETLILSGYSTNTEADYKIVYKKME